MGEQDKNAMVQVDERPMLAISTMNESKQMKRIAKVGDELRN